MGKTTQVKANKQIHPNSRIAKRMAFKVDRTEQIGQKKALHLASSADRVQEKLWWFKDNLPMDTSILHISESELTEMARIFVHRNDEKLEELKAINSARKGQRPKANEEAMLELSIRADLGEFRSNLLVPDLTTNKGMKLLREWDGVKRGIHAIPMRSVYDTEAKGEKAAAASSSMVA